MTLVSAAPPHRVSVPPARTIVEAFAVALLAVYAATFVLALPTGAWLIARDGTPGHFDFAEFWSAGRIAALGHATRAYDWSALATLLPPVFKTSGFPFYYPPPVLLALAPLGGLPFGVAAALAFGLSVAAWALLSHRFGAGRAAALAIAASPAVFQCLVVVQTGLPLAVLAGAALLAAPRRPILAGLLLAAVAMKPQTAVLFPVAFLAAGRWRSLVACAAGFAGLVGLSLLAFGPSAWFDWLHAVHPGAGMPAPLAGLPPAKLQSVYGLLLAMGPGRAPAMVAQGLSALAAAGWTAWLWRGERPWDLKAAGLCAAALLVSPYSAVYDLPITVVALGFLLRDATRRPLGAGEGAALGAAYLAPALFLVEPSPYGPWICGLLCTVVTLRCRRTTRSSLTRALEATAAA